MKKLTALLLALALALPLAACGSQDAPAAVVRYGLSNAWDSLMPYNSPSGSNYTRIVCDKIYDRLAYVHADGALDPRGAASWESADGGYAVLFRLDQPHLRGLVQAQSGKIRGLIAGQRKTHIWNLP